VGAPGHSPNTLFSGASGLDGTNLLPPPLHPPNPQNAILAARDALLATQQHTAWVVATGALTNIALLFATFPEVGAWIKGLSIMGGVIGDGFTNAPMGKVDGKERAGNWTNWAEFNISVRILLRRTANFRYNILVAVWGYPDPREYYFDGHP
jgi:inosine-uridine nucleoside N-ribohydrolase